jgi:hypothetical protein
MVDTVRAVIPVTGQIAVGTVSLKTLATSRRSGWGAELDCDNEVTRKSDEREGYDPMWHGDIPHPQDGSRFHQDYEAEVCR